MPRAVEIDRLSRLLDTISLRSRPFLDQCSDAKMLAISDVNLALERYWNLTKQAFYSDGVHLPDELSKNSYYQAVKQALGTRVLTASYVDALEKLRSSFLDGVLRPAVGAYLENQTHRAELEQLYENALRLDGLLDLANFLRKVSHR